jgi:DNA-binding CsgD family transcriptional regulator
MDIPDYIAPIVGYRCWQWDGSRLLSLNGQRWSPGSPLAARCHHSHSYPLAGRLWRTGRLPSNFQQGFKPGPRQAPLADCTCGIYALKTGEQLGEFGEAHWRGISGEVYLWGTIIEHSHGYRAQYAYPKRLVVSAPCDPLSDDGLGSGSVEEVQSHLESMTKYAADIFLPNGVPVWTVRSGYDDDGLKSLHEVLARMHEVLARMHEVLARMHEVLARIESLREILAGNESLRPILTARELELLPFLCQGMTTFQIGMRLGLNEHAVRSYMFRIFDKLGVSGRTELVELLLSSSAPDLRPLNPQTACTWPDGSILGRSS